MEARRNPDYLKITFDAVAELQKRFEEFVELHLVNMEMRGLAPALIPREDVDEAEVRRRRLNVSRAAGRAGEVAQLTGTYVAVQGLGKIDPFAAWGSMTQPKPAIEPDNLRDACAQAMGRLESMIAKAEAEAPPTGGAEALHPLVWTAAARLWRDGHYKEAVTRAAETLVLQLKTQTGRNDLSETSLWQETFSHTPPLPGKPRLRWPGNPDDRDVKSMNDGLRQFTAGVQMTIRNTSVHAVAEMEEQAALERLTVLSLLARWMDECELQQAEEPT